MAESLPSSCTHVESSRHLMAIKRKCNHCSAIDAHTNTLPLGNHFLFRDSLLQWADSLEAKPLYSNDLQQPQGKGKGKIHSITCHKVTDGD